MVQDPTAILFDKDGTLIDYHKSWSGVNRAAALMAARDDPELAARLLVVGGFNPALGRTEPDTPLAAGSAADIARVWVSAGSPWPQRELEAALDGLFQDVVDMAVPVTDLEALFGRLKSRGFRLGIASSDSERAIRRTASRFGIDVHVDFVAGYDSGFGAKPDAGMFDAFCRAVGVLPAQAVMVGDNAHDMAMAAAGGAGLRIAVLTGTGTRQTLASCCDACIESISQLEDLLKGGNTAVNQLADQIQRR
jgi:phosphoglycolate phosphatase